ncbi:class I SAM-dependent DNA methyltransferase, partial [Candidatus Electronema sp. TJ]|uniref:class I SAM-dependent DNA methyltransferase n=1 Tax=Candidatus Electronema sp. TJ TaxID=3401573 RepID=UPI003AA9CB06
LEEFPAQIAQVALWLTDHQMNQQVSEEFGLYFARIPLKTSPNIVCANALRMDWNELIPAERLHYIMGNPPFVGAKFMSEEQRADALTVFGDIKNAGLLDFVTAWHVKAARMIQNSSIRCAFVSTNSICQGEQVGVLWNWLLAQGIKIFFAHRTFQWSNEARGKAAVHCVIVGFAYEDIAPKWLFEYEDIRGEAQRIAAENINPYLVNAPNVTLSKRSAPIVPVPEMKFGNQPIDGGGFILTPEEKDCFVNEEPSVAPYIRKFLGSDEFINNGERYCLWLKDMQPQEMKKHPRVMERLAAVKAFRLASNRAATRELADTPSQFAFVSHTETPYLVVPSVSSERRQYIPIGFMPADVIASNLCLIVPDADFYHFGVLSSVMHNAWMRTVCGRLESRYRYSASIVYNNFPWPENPSGKQRQAIETAAQAVLDARAQFPDSSLADLYDPLTMPPVLLKAHRVLDKAVDAAYGKSSFSAEAARVAFLFDLYQKYTASLLPL